MSAPSRCTHLIKSSALLLQAKLESLDAAIVQRGEGAAPGDQQTPATTQSRRKVLTCVGFFTFSGFALALPHLAAPQPPPPSRLLVASALSLVTATCLLWARTDRVSDSLLSPPQRISAAPRKLATDMDCLNAGLVGTGDASTGKKSKRGGSSSSKKAARSKENSPMPVTAITAAEQVAPGSSARHVADDTPPLNMKKIPNTPMLSTGGAAHGQKMR